MTENLKAFDDEAASSELSLAKRLERIRQLAAWCKARFGKAPDVEKLIQEMLQGKSIQKRRERKA
jgi:hypothetical protein